MSESPSPALCYIVRQVLIYPLTASPNKLLLMALISWSSTKPRISLSFPESLHYPALNDTKQPRVLPTRISGVDLQVLTERRSFTTTMPKTGALSSRLISSMSQQSIERSGVCKDSVLVRYVCIFVVVLSNRISVPRWLNKLKPGKS
jgi:hypothetical protein